MADTVEITVQRATLEIVASAIPGGGDLSGLEALSGTGLAARTGTSTWATRTVTASGAGLSVANGDGVAGNPTVSLADDAAAVEALSSTGVAVRTGASTWAVRTLTAGSGISIADGDGVAGNPTISASATASEITAAPGAQQDDYSPTGWSTASRVKIEATAICVITGWAARTAATVVEFENTGAIPVIFQLYGTSSTAPNRMATREGRRGAMVVFPGDVVRGVYDGTLARLVIHKTRSIVRPGDAEGTVHRLLPYSGNGLVFEMPFGGTGGNLETPTPATASEIDSIWRARARTGTTTGNAAGRTHGGVVTLLPSGGLGDGGFACEYSFGLETAGDTSLDVYVGLSSTISPGAGNPYTQSNMGHTLGFGIVNGDSNWSVWRNDASGTATRVDLGASFAVDTTKILRAILYNDPNNSRMVYAIWRDDEGGLSEIPVVGEFTSDLPTGAMGAFWQVTTRSNDAKSIFLRDWHAWTP